MTGERLAYLSLRFDAVYCIVLGLVVAIIAPVVASEVALPPLLLVGVGVATLLWGVYVWRAASASPIRLSSRRVMLANIVATSGLALTGVVAGTTVLTLAAFALAIDVAAFAVSQGIAIRRMRASAA